MKHTLKPLLIGLPVLALVLAFAYPKPNTPEDPEKNYAASCAGCHGVEYKTFVDRDWVFVQNEMEMEAVIANGLEDYGMPGFAELFSEKEITELSQLLWKESQKKKKQRDGSVSVIDAGQTFRVDTLIRDLEVPWGLTFLPNGDLLLTERRGELLRYSGNVFQARITGLPPIFAKGQGGLLDVELHPEYEENGWLYLAYSYPDTETGRTGNTAIMRARLKNDELVDQEVLFEGTPLSRSGVHFGCRLEFDRDGYLFFGLGERGNPANAQDLGNHSGKVHRIFDDGSIPPDNPFVNTPGAIASIYSYGHRNPQGLALHPETGIIWVHEHGPKGGDEINIIQKGKNYGWPEITYGINYNGTIITEDTAKVGMEQPFLYWTPSIAPCGLCFVEGDRYPDWKGDMMVGSLSFTYLHRVNLRGSELINQEKLLEGIGRVRAIEQDADGILYVAVERPGMLLRLLPE